MEINLSLIAVYAIGTLFGMIIGARWGIFRGMRLGIKATVAELEEQQMLPSDWRKQLQNQTVQLTPEAMEKLIQDLEDLDKEDKK